MLNVGATLGSRQAGLRRTAADATQGAEHGEAEMTREVVGLVEAALKSSERMERHRHDRIGVGKDVSAGFTEKARERSCERATPLVLECVDDVTQRTVVATGTASER